MRKNTRKGFVLVVCMMLLSMTLTGCKKEKEEVTDTPVATTETTEESKTSVEEDSKNVATNSSKPSVISKEDASAKETTEETKESTDNTFSKDGAPKKETTEETRASTDNASSKEENKTSGAKVDTSKKETTKAEASSAASKTEETKSSVSSAKPADTQTSSNETGTSSTSAPDTKPSTPPATPSAPAHTHSWDGGTVTKAATCGEDGVRTYSCSCGESRTESIPATGAHNYVTVVDSEPGCDYPGWSYNLCTQCNRTGGGWATSALGHDIESYEKHGGDCVTGAQIGNRCRRCGIELSDTFGEINPNNHNWVTKDIEQFNETTFKWETVTVTYCANGCGATQ